MFISVKTIHAPTVTCGVYLSTSLSRTASVGTNQLISDWLLKKNAVGDFIIII